jgi:hypothetical protein
MSINTKEQQMVKMTDVEAMDIYREALDAGHTALQACRPTPMVVQEHVNMLDDNSQVKQEWFVGDGVCGFAWVHMKCKGVAGEFIRAMKRNGIAGGENDRGGNIRINHDSYYHHYSFWVHEGNQSMQKKEAFAEAFADVLKKHGIVCHAGSRMD